MWSTGEGNGKPLQYSCLENPMNGMIRQTDRILKEELPRSVGAQYAPGVSIAALQIISSVPSRVQIYVFVYNIFLFLTYSTLCNRL